MMSNDYPERARELVEALEAFARAKIAYERALDALEDAKRDRILAGLEGKNETERRAFLAREVAGEEERVREARDRLRIAEAALEKARVLERLARETARLLHPSDPVV